MKRTNILLILGFLCLISGIIVGLAKPYNIFKIRYLSFFLIAGGTFLIIVEIVTYHRSLYK